MAATENGAAPPAEQWTNEDLARFGERLSNWDLVGEYLRVEELIAGHRPGSYSVDGLLARKRVLLGLIRDESRPTHLRVVH